MRALVAVVIVCACGDNRLAGPDAGAAAIDAARDAAIDAAPAACERSITPADGATRVSPYATIVIELDAPPASDADIAVIAPHATNPLPATVAIDGCRVTITPRVALDGWATYRVRAPGLTTTFTTVNDPWIRRTGVNQAGSITSGELHEVDDLGRVTRQVAIGSVGPDGVLGTADDHVSYLASFTYDASGPLTVSHQYWPGPDTVLGTADDVLSSIETYDDQPANPYVRTWARTKGADGILGTTDDMPAGLVQRSFQADGRVSGLAVWTDSGPDGVPFTDDDTLDTSWVVTDTQTLTYDPTGLVGINALTRDAAGHIIESIQYGNGPDGIIGTADDTTDQIFLYDYDAIHGQLVRWRAIANPGPDHVWLTADDLVYHDDRWDYDADGNVHREYDVAAGYTSDVIYYEPIVAP